MGKTSQHSFVHIRTPYKECQRTHIETFRERAFVVGRSASLTTVWVHWTPALSLNKGSNIQILTKNEPSFKFKYKNTCVLINSGDFKETPAFCTTGGHKWYVLLKYNWCFSSECDITVLYHQLTRPESTTALLYELLRWDTHRQIRCHNTVSQSWICRLACRDGSPCGTTPRVRKDAAMSHTWRRLWAKNECKNKKNIQAKCTQTF